ncbi:MAG: translation elongation factor Ts [Acholeplasmataceae bacterium]|nr:translation elongation factor Ts [Acholeplasmataceae bacterium]
MSTQLIKALRAETGAGIKACQDALRAANQDYDAAKAIILTSITPKDGNQRVASKGLCAIDSTGDEAIIFEVNAETDFAAKNPYFIDLLGDLKAIFRSCDAVSATQAKKCQSDGMSVAERIEKASVLVSEHLSLRRFYRVKKHQSQTFGVYVHQGGKVIGLVILDGKDDDLAYLIARQIVAATPTYINWQTLDEETLAYERMMFEKTHDPFDQHAFEVYLETQSLIHQQDVSNPVKTIRDHLENAHAAVIDFFRIEVGQGIENKLNCRLDIPCDGSKITVMPIY